MKYLVAFLVSLSAMILAMLIVNGIAGVNGFNLPSFLIGYWGCVLYYIVRTIYPDKNK